MSRLTERDSFSLLELTVIISILAILICLAIPNLRALTERSHRIAAATHLRTIALAHINYMRDHGHSIRSSDFRDVGSRATTMGDANLVAALLAKYGYINDVSVWIWDFDPLREKGITTIYDAATDRIADHFRGQQSGGNTPLSVVCCIAQDTFQDDDALLSSKIPCCYSRGLSKQGVWDAGVFGNRGGLIAFFDGHVEWFQTLEERFYQYGTQQTTQDLTQTLPEGAYFVSWKGKE